MKMKFNQIVVGLVTCALIAGLSGCSGAPSSSDINKLLENGISKNNREEQNVGLNNLVVTIESIKKLGCTKSDGAEYVCDVDIVSSSVANGKTESVSKIRFAKGSSGWVVAGIAH